MCVCIEFDGKICCLIFLCMEFDDEVDYKCIVRNDFGMVLIECELLVEEEYILFYFKKKFDN